MGCSNFVVSAAMLVLLVLPGCGDGDSTSRDSDKPGQTLLGSWDFIGFTDDGVATETTGTAEFRSDATFLIEGTITIPGNPTDDANISGTYEEGDGMVTLTIGGESKPLTVEFAGDQVVLTERDQAPPGAEAGLRPDRRDALAPSGTLG